MLADSIEERREQQLARGVWPGKETGKNAFRSPVFPFLAGQARGIKKCAIRHTTLQQTFLVEAVESGHYGGVSERTIQLLNHIANVALSTRPEDLH